MDVIFEILRTVAIVLLCILALIAGLYMVLLFFDRWLKHKSGSSEQEGLSSLLAEAYTNRKSPSDQKSDEKKEDAGSLDPDPGSD